MTILGISGMGHDSSVTILADGRPVMAIEEERLTRLKHAWKFPWESLRFAVEYLGLQMRDVDEIAFFFDPTSYRLAPYLSGLDRTALLPGRFLLHLRTRFFFKMMLRFAPQYFIAPVFAGEKLAPIRFVEHHLAHLGSAFLCSDFDQALCVVVDGFGEFPCTSVYDCQGRAFRRLAMIGYPNSLGMVYSAVTQHLGFKPFGEEPKVMSLAALGGRNRKFELFFDDLLRSAAKGAYGIDTRFTNYHLAHRLFSRRFLNERAEEHLGPPRLPHDPIKEEHLSIAFHVQERIREVMVRLIGWHLERRKHRNLCLAGGVALNCVLNGMLLGELPVDRIFVQPAAGDAGASLGAALIVWNNRFSGERVYSMSNAFLGPEYSEDAVISVLRKAGIRYRKVADPAEVAARLLASGKTVGWFQGRMEFGPRALGHRSLLGHPSNEMVKRKIDSIKSREPYRPYSPSILANHLSHYLGEAPESPYMLLALPVRPESRGQLACTTHVDGTARYQSVSEEADPLFVSLIEKFRDLTGIPAVLNTSLNLKGQAMAMTPSDAVQAYSMSRMDALVLGKLLVCNDGVGDEDVTV